MLTIPRSIARVPLVRGIVRLALTAYARFFKRRYFIDRRNGNSDYHLALHISYPDQNDLHRAALLGVEPGGAIMIHGEPSYLTPTERKRLKTDWTAGCIALTNPEIDEVWRLVDNGVEVDIYP